LEVCVSGNCPAGGQGKLEELCQVTGVENQWQY